jgi:hypothetical protein
MPKSEDPLGRLGVYKSIEDVPDRYRLRVHESKYAGRDVWQEYRESELSGAAETVRRETDLVERSWKKHMEDQGRHHALATPSDVETWIPKLLERMQLVRAYNPYWVRLEEFYDYLMWHKDHPHVYHPPRMAAGLDGSANEIWTVKTQDWDV